SAHFNGQQPNRGKDSSTQHPNRTAEKRHGYAADCGQKPSPRPTYTPLYTQGKKFFSGQYRDDANDCRKNHVRGKNCDEDDQGNTNTSGEYPLPLGDGRVRVAGLRQSRDPNSNLTAPT